MFTRAMRILYTLRDVTVTVPIGAERAPTEILATDRLEIRSGVMRATDLRFSWLEFGARSLRLASSGSVGADDNSGKIVVGGAVSGDDLTLGRLGGGRDDQVVGSSRPALPAHEGE